MGGFVVRSKRKVYFFNIDGNGDIYERSDQPLKDFVPHKNPITGQFAGYRKLHPYGLVAWLNGVDVISKKNNQGQQVYYFVLTFTDYESDVDYQMYLNLYTPKGGLHRYVKSFVKYSKNIDLTRRLLFNSFKRKADDQYSPSELYFAYHTQGMKDIMVERYYKKGCNGWPDSEKEFYMGKETVSYRKQDEFAYRALMDYIKEFKEKIIGVRVELESQFGKKDTGTEYEMPVDVPYRKQDPGIPENMEGDAAVAQKPEEYPTPGQPEPAARPSGGGGFVAANTQEPPKMEYDDDLPF